METPLVWTTKILSDTTLGMKQDGQGLPHFTVNYV